MSRRTERVSDVLRETLAELLQRDLRDPRLQQQLVSITGVKVSPDLKLAHVYISTLGSEHERRDVVAALNQARGFLRRELGPRLVMRNVPELHFHEDDSIERGVRIFELLKEIEREPKADGPQQ